jgi:hypothetical protein
MAIVIIITMVKIFFIFVTFLMVQLLVAYLCFFYCKSSESGRTEKGIMPKPE